MPKRPYLLLAAAALAVTALAVTPATGQEVPTPEPTELADDTLRQAVAALEAGREAGAEVELVDGRARVEILHHSDTATITALVEAAGGEVYGDVPGQLVEGLVPWPALGDLEATAEIDFIRTPESVSEPIDDGPVGGSGAEYGFSSQELRKTRADTWHQAGITGDGVGVGIIDLFSEEAWDHAAANAELPDGPTDTFCQVNGSACSVWDDDEAHGVAVAEVVQDMAPDAELYLVRAETASDLQAAVNWLAAEGVTVVTRSLTSPYDGPGDGTGPIASVIDAAVAAGMTFVQAAGNSAGQSSSSPPRPGSYLRWTFADTDADGWVEFAPGDERLTVDCGYLNGLRWDDFDDVDATDYDLYVYNGNGTVLQDTSADDQGAGAPPIERTDDCTTTRNQVAVRLAGDPGQEGTAGDVLELMMNGVGFERWTNQGSASGPAADTANAGALTVGAVAPWNGTRVAWFSSRGPTNDGRRKPDLVAASCLSSVITTPYCFGGTSAAAPVAAGAAALRREDSPSSDPATVAAWLIDEATVDRGAVGPDNVAGAGELILPSRGPRPRYRPDARIARSTNGVPLGNGIYNRTGAGQSIRIGTFGGSTLRFTVLLENDGTGPERFAVGGSRGVAGFSTTYIRPSTAGVPTRVITGPVTRGEYFTEVVRPGRSTRIEVMVRVPARSPARSIRGVLQVFSYANFTTTDLVAFTIERY